MITYVKRKDLDIEKYDFCISNAQNSRIYAYSWYLDCIADNWDVLVLNDYEAVMPLPWQEKYYVKYVYLVGWAQQLGVFYTENKENLVDTFFKEIPEKYKLVDVNLNSANFSSNLKLTKRVNYILDLNYSYEELFKNFSKGRKSDIKKAEKSEIRVKESENVKNLIELFLKEKTDVINAEYAVLERLSENLIAKNKAKVLEVYDENSTLIGGTLFLFDAKRITYLFSAVSKIGKQKKVMPFLISKMIKEHANSNYIFDFEGSMIKTIASFFEGFGAEKETYYHYKKYRLL